MRFALVMLCLACSLAAFVAPLPRAGRARRAAVHCSAEAAAVAIITGGSGGIGLATAHRLAEKGFDCVLAYGSNDEQAASARSELEAAHDVRVRTVRGDLTQDESRTETVAEVFRVVDEELSGKVGALRTLTLTPARALALAPTLTRWAPSCTRPASSPTTCSATTLLARSTASTSTTRTSRSTPRRLSTLRRVA